ncbi:hypothetical protein BGZ65_000947 [Modicella reniformis]|uniref:Uncharacterized protein n=1 Tax=Modicella reniformis TaxID=1440133 RepID=A0A9P6MJ03_9FUNG|nr:hypothetical protein BGZ65_000947 [Modicella reniformis]
MSKRAIKLVTSISYGDDVVGRLSLGSVRNIGHAMRALMAMRPAPPLSPPASPVLTATTSATSDEEVVHDSSELLDDLLEAEGENLYRTRHQQEEKKRKRSHSKREKRQKPTQTSVGLEIVQKVIRWKLTGEEQLFEEFMDIRRAMTREMNKHQETYEGGDFYPEGTTERERRSNIIMITPNLVPPGKVLWIRPTSLEKELENAETRRHPIDNVIHQFEWDHPIEYNPSSLLKPISHQFQQHLEDDQSDSASIRSIKSTICSSLYTASSSSLPNLSTSPPTTPRITRTPSSSDQAVNEEQQQQQQEQEQHQNLHPRIQRQTSLDSIHSIYSTMSTSTTSPASLHPNSENTDKLLYRLYAVPRPENVFDEMLFSRRMWSDHLPLTYEFILAGKHAIPVTSPAAQREKVEIAAAAAAAARGTTTTADNK